jgi:hypothetical protein
MVIGLFLMVLGGRFARLAFEITTTLIVGTVLIVWFFSTSTPVFSPTWVVWLGIYVCYGIALGVGFGASRWPKIGVIIVGLSLGAFIGVIFGLLVV